MPQEKFKLKCPQCGSTQFKAPSPKPGPDDPLICTACNTTITIGEMKVRIEREARAAIEERFRDQIKPE